MDKIKIPSKLEIALERKIYKKSLYEFYKAAFCQLHPGESYDENWHAKYICDILQEETFRVVEGRPREKDIIINISPRSSKSMIVSVIWPAWAWTIKSSLKFITGSYSDTLAVNHARLTKDLIIGKWYQRLFGYRIKLRGDLQGAGHYGNTDTGFRYAFGLDGTVTGFGGDFILCLRGDQKILTNKGEIDIKQIVENKLKVKILTFNKNKNALQYRKIKRYDKNLNTKRLMKIVTKKGKEIICTEDHEIWTENRGYVLAKNLTTEDIVRTI